VGPKDEDIVRIGVELSTAVLIVVAPIAADAFPRDFAIFPLSIRSAGMGKTGTADHADMANVAQNPAVVSMRRCVHATWSTSEVSFLLADVRLDGVVVGGGYQWELNERWAVGSGVAAGIAKERWGWKGNWEAYRRG
jgi:long-subunit fatty acid transport protein